MKTLTFEILDGLPLRVRFELENKTFVTADIFDLRSINENADMFLKDADYYHDEILEMGDDFLNYCDYKLEN